MDRTRAMKNALALLLIYPRLLSFLTYCGSGSTRHGWRKERCRPWMAVCATGFRDRSENSDGTRRAELPQRQFWLLFLFLIKWLPLKAMSN